MNFSAIKYCDIANGLGVRTSLFVSGCTLHCAGCFNAVAQDFNAGQPFTQEVEDAIIRSLEPNYIAGLSVLGGEPMEPVNQAGILPLLERVKAELTGKNIWLYSGFLFEDLCSPENPKHVAETDRILELVDVLVDGPFVEAKKDISLRFRGSNNQRVIDMAKTRELGEVYTLWGIPQNDSERSHHAR